MRSLEWLFVLALILYTTAIWSHKIKKELKPWMITIFGIALATDTFVTVVVCIIYASKLSLDFHAVAGLLSLVIMAFHFFGRLALTAVPESSPAILTSILFTRG